MRRRNNAPYRRYRTLAHITMSPTVLCGWREFPLGRAPISANSLENGRKLLIPRRRIFMIRCEPAFRPLSGRQLPSSRHPGAIDSPPLPRCETSSLESKARGSGSGLPLSVRLCRRRFGRHRIVRFAVRFRRANMVGKLTTGEVVGGALINLPQHGCVPFRATPPLFGYKHPYAAPSDWRAPSGPQRH